MNSYQIEFFQKSNGEAPAEDFINSLDKKLRAKFYRMIQMLKENGPNLREPYSKHLQDGIFELRPTVATNAVRVLYFFFIERRIVITNGFIRKTQQTPSSEIKIAQKYRDEFLKRKDI